jgi:serine protease Do
MSSNQILITRRNIITSTAAKLAFAALAFSLGLFIGLRDSHAQTVNFTAATNSGPVASYADVVSRVAPAVVTIHTEGHVKAEQQPSADDLLGQLFGNRSPRGQQQQPSNRRREALGSGVIVSADGYILTNFHVIDEAEQVRVELTDNRTFDAKVVGSDKASDLAVLKVSASNLPILPLGNSDDMRVGDVVLAIGNPLGIGQTVTSGIISAKGRATNLGDGGFEDFIQTDAAINQGNSGGALINSRGDLIGINSQILSPSGGNIGIGFSIPSNMARSVMEQLVQTGKVRRSKLGVGIQPLTSDIAAGLGISQVRGAIVTSVEAGSPAALAGIQRGDVITAFNGAPVTDTNSLRNQVARTQPGTNATVTVIRDNHEQQLKVTVSELLASSRKSEAAGSEDPSTTNSGKLGVEVEPLTGATAERLGAGKEAKGLVVVGLDPSGPAAEAGLKQGDVIEEANRQAVQTVADLKAAVQNANAKPLLLLIDRQGQTAYIPVRLSR